MSTRLRHSDQHGFVLLSLVLGLGLLSLGALRLTTPPGAEVGAGVDEERREIESIRQRDAESPAEMRTRLRLVAAREALR